RGVRAPRCRERRQPAVSDVSADKGLALSASHTRYIFATSPTPSDQRQRALAVHAPVSSDRRDDHGAGEGWGAQSSIAVVGLEQRRDGVLDRKRAIQLCVLARNTLGREFAHPSARSIRELVTQTR